MHTSSDLLMTRSYGKISGDSLRLILAGYREAWSERNSLLEQIAGKSLDYVSKRFSEVSWWPLYELSFSEFAVFQADIMGLNEVLRAAANSESPSDAFLSLISEFDFEETPPRGREVEGIAVAIVMMKNLESVAHYALSMHDLIAQVSASNHGMAALRRAASIDIAVFALPRVQALLSAMQIAGSAERKSLLSVQRSAALGPHKNIKHRELRWLEYILRDRGAFDVCSQDEIHDLLVNGLRLYPDEDAASSKESLFKLFGKWRANQSPKF